jgi:hypothetical protein
VEQDRRRLVTSPRNRDRLTERAKSVWEEIVNLTPVVQQRVMRAPRSVSGENCRKRGLVLAHAVANDPCQVVGIPKHESGDANRDAYQ